MIDQQQQIANRQACIKIIGVGGAGCNILNRFCTNPIPNVECWIADTDTRSLSIGKTTNRIQLGKRLLQGKGTKGKPLLGASAAEASRQEITHSINGADVVFIIAAMGGGCGAGAAPIIAQIAKELGAITIGFGLLPFSFEQRKYRRNANGGIQQFQNRVTALVKIKNQHIMDEINNRTCISEVFQLLSQFLQSSIYGLIHFLSQPNLDLNQIRSAIGDRELATIGYKESIVDSNWQIIESSNAIAPKFQSATFNGAELVISNMIAGVEISESSTDEFAEIIRPILAYNATVLVRATLDPKLEQKIQATTFTARFSDDFDLSKIIRRIL